jgi:hypothetical protein
VALHQYVVLQVKQALVVLEGRPVAEIDDLSLAVVMIDFSPLCFDPRMQTQPTVPRLIPVNELRRRTWHTLLHHELFITHKDSSAGPFLTRKLQ